jgi:hydroxymethylbilane synthase
VGTSSLRREAQLKAIRPDLTILPVRGNVDTRIRKTLQGDYDAIVLAAAGVERLNLAQYVTEYLSFDVILPAPGQGALAIQCRSNDAELRALLAPLHDVGTERAVTAERAFLSGLGGGCSAPIAALAQSHGETVELQGLVASTDGRRVIRVTGAGDQPAEVGQDLARQAMDQGAGALLP